MTFEGSARLASASRVPPGTQLNGIFEIDQAIGTGGMGEIYKGHAIQTGDPVAIKVIRADLAQNEAAEGLFRKEASILHNLLHDAIVRYYVVSKDPGIGRLYLAMEFVDGLPLSEVLEKGPLSYEAVRSLQRRLAAGLQAAHELGVVHRDISPDNIILPGGDVTRAKIIDFGIARSATLGGATIIGGGFAGKYNYVSPEQLGLSGGDVTGKSDIYSMGLVLAEALTGRPIDMGGSQVDIVEKRRRVPDLAAIDLRMRPLIERMLQPRPEDRPGSMAEVAAWRPDVTAEPTIAPAIAATRGVPRQPSARRSWVGPLAAIVLLAAVGLGGAAAVYWLDLWPQPEAPIDIATNQPGDTGDALTPPPGNTGPPVDAGDTVTPPPAGNAGDVQPTTGPPPGDAGTAVPSGDAGTPQLQPPPGDATTPGPPAEPPITGDTGATTTGDASTPPSQPPSGNPDGTEVAPGTPPGDAGNIATGDNAAKPPGEPSSGDKNTTLVSTEPPAGSPDTGGPPPQPGADGKLANVIPQVPPRPPEPELPESRTVKVTDYVRRYQGGECFFAAPTVTEAASVLKAKVEVFSAAVPPVEAFDGSFRRDNGFEADIGLRQVTEKQCPVVDFLRHADTGAELAPRLTMGSLAVRASEPLTGAIEGIGGRSVSLLLVTDAGVVYDLSKYLTRTDAGERFDLKVEGASKTAAEPHLLLAVATDVPLDLPGSGTPAEPYFAQLLSMADARLQPLAVAVKYFKLGG